MSKNQQTEIFGRIGQETEWTGAGLRRFYCISLLRELGLHVSFLSICALYMYLKFQPQALQCDMEGDRKGLLHGIPISIKENYFIQVI